MVLGRMNGSISAAAKKIILALVLESGIVRVKSSVLATPKKKKERVYNSLEATVSALVSGIAYATGKHVNASMRTRMCFIPLFNSGHEVNQRCHATT